MQTSTFLDNLKGDNLKVAHKRSLKLGSRIWGCNKWWFTVCLAALPGNRPKSAFFCPFSAFFALSGGPKQHLGYPENVPRKKKKKKGPFLAQLAPFGPSPRLLRPRLDFPEPFSRLRTVLLAIASFLLTVELLCLQLCLWGFFSDNCSLSTSGWRLLLTVGKRS